MLKTFLAISICSSLGIVSAQVIPIAIDGKAIVGVLVAVGSACIWAGRQFQKIIDRLDNLQCGGGKPCPLGFKPKEGCQ